MAVTIDGGNIAGPPRARSGLSLFDGADPGVLRGARSATIHRRGLASVYR